MREELFMFWLSLEGHIAKIKYDILVANYGSLLEAYELFFFEFFLSLLATELGIFTSWT